MSDTNIASKREGQKLEAKVVNKGALTGFFYSIIIGFALYFVLNSVQTAGNWFQYETVIAGVAEGSLYYKFIWYLMNITEPQFYAGILATIGVIAGGFVAWRLSISNSKFAGFEVCYGSANMWPWVLASQILSLFIAVFILNYTRFFANGEYTWLPTFISVVAVPPSMMLLYGPSYRVLFTGSILGGLLSFPIGFWIMTEITPVLALPGVVGHVLTMALTGIIVGQIFNVIPWIEKAPPKELNVVKIQLSKQEEYEQMSKPSWFVRRVFADFSEAQFYGNEIAGIFVLVGASLDWILNSGHLSGGAGALPAIILSQFIAAAVGILLYFEKYYENGWYGTYIPVVSVGPACVLAFGATVPIAIISGTLGAIIGPPLAEYLNSKLPPHIHGTVGNVTSMAITTAVVYVVIQALPWF